MNINQIARDLAAEIISLPAPPSPLLIVLPEVDEEPVRRAENIGDAEGQSFLIEYVNSAGKPSTRRITVWSIVGGTNGIPSLLAHCHERKAQRQFRVDRIQCFIDYDGEVFDDVPLFLEQNFGMALPVSTKRADDGARWAGILNSIRHDAVLLAALAKSDGKVRPEEIEVETDYLASLAERTGVMLDDGDIASIRRFAGRLRPSEEAIMRALNALTAEGETRTKRLLMAAVRVIDADGKRHEKELAMINAISLDLTGVEIL